MKYRKHDWFNTETKEVKYGIQAQFNGAWKHCCEDSKLLIYDTEQERKNKLKELRAAERAKKPIGV